MFNRIQKRVGSTGQTGQLYIPLFRLRYKLRGRMYESHRRWVGETKPVTEENAPRRAAVSTLQEINRSLAGGASAYCRHVVAAGHNLGRAVRKYGGKRARGARYIIVTAAYHQDG